MVVEKGPGVVFRRGLGGSEVERGQVRGWFHRKVSTVRIVRFVEEVFGVTEGVF